METGLVDNSVAAVLEDAYSVFNLYDKTFFRKECDASVRAWPRIKNRAQATRRVCILLVGQCRLTEA